MKRRIKGFIALFFLYSACTSKTAVEDRFADSRNMSYAGASGISLADPNQFSFGMVGDLHIGGRDTNRLRRILSAASAEGDSFLIFLGDIVDQGHRDDFVAFQSALLDTGWNGKVLCVVGNHDIFYDGWQNYRELIGPSNYAVSMGSSKFIALDTADASLGESQTVWLKDELKKERPARLFLLSHYLPAIPGYRTYLKLSDEEEAAFLMKLASTYDVKGWFGAHYHSFVTGEIAKVSYVVAGGGGGRRMEPVKSYFFVQVRVSGSEVSYQIREVE